MKIFKLPYFILAAGIFILTFNTILSSSINSKYSEINGRYKTGKVSVNVLDDLASQGRSSFTMNDIRNLKEFSFKDTDMTSASVNKAVASYKDSQAEAEVYGIDEKYSMFHQIKMKSGSFITGGNKDENVAVVDESLAQALFNNDSVVGMHVELYNRDFRIIGVISPDQSILQTITDSGTGSIYINVEKMLEYDKNSKITSIEVGAGGESTTGQNISNMETALASIGKNASNYKIIDYNLENILVAQKARVCIFLTGTGAIIMLLKLVKKRAEDICQTIKSGLKENYFRDILKLKYVNLALTGLEISAMLVSVYLIWAGVKFNLYIPPRFVPDELIDIAFFRDLFKSLAQAKVQNIGYIPTFTELKANALRRMQDWNMYTGLLAGFPLYFLGHKLLELKENYVKHLLFCFIILFFSMLLGISILIILKMPVAVDIKGILVILTFIFLSISRNYTYQIP